MQIAKTFINNGKIKLDTMNQCYINSYTVLFMFFCLSNKKFERLGDPLDEIVTISVHTYNVIMPRPNVTSFDPRDGLARRWLLHLGFYSSEDKI